MDDLVDLIQSSETASEHCELPYSKNFMLLIEQLGMDCKGRKSFYVYCCSIMCTPCLLLHHRALLYYRAAHLRNMFYLKIKGALLYPLSQRVIISTVPFLVGMAHLMFVNSASLLCLHPGQVIILLLDDWNNLRTVFPAILPPRTSVYTATIISICFKKCVFHHGTPLLKA